MEAEGIHYFVLNDHFGTLRVGSKTDPLNAKNIYVHEEFYESVKDIIDDFAKSIKNDSGDGKSHDVRFMKDDKHYEG